MDTLKRILSHFQDYTGALVLGIFCSAIVAVCTIFFAWIM